MHRVFVLYIVVLMTDRRENLGYILATRGSEAMDQVKTIEGQIAALQEERDRLLQSIVEPLEMHQGHLRLVTGEPLQPEGVGHMEDEVLYIEKAGVPTQEEAAKFSLGAIVKAVREDSGAHQAYWFNPMNSNFNLKPLELAEQSEDLIQ